MDNCTCASPRSSLELQLVQIWEDLLDQRPIGIHDDFFEIGGDSLAAMSLLARVVQETGLSLPVAGLLKSPTVAQLAAALGAERCPTDWSPAVPLQSEGTQPPFFCVHPAGGNVLCYLRLAQRLGKHRPFYGLEARGIEGNREPKESIPEMVTEYVDAIRKLQPQGPYSLGGWSFGGLAAFEIAQRLLAEGEEVRHLAIIDSGVLHSLAVMKTVLPGGVFKELRLPEDELLARFRQRASTAQIIPENADDKMGRQILRIFISNVHAMLDYRLKPYPSQMVLYQATEKCLADGREPYREWIEVCDQVDLQVVPGDHLTLIHEPHVKQLAAKLGEYLDAEG